MEMSPELQIQYLTPKEHFFTYIPRSKECSKRLDAERQFVIRFKNGNEIDQRHAANFVVDFLRSGNMVGSQYTFMCIPASSKEKHELRYRKFMDRVCKRCRLENAFELVDVVCDRAEVHAGGSRDIKNYLISPEVSGKKIILFDDVETSGLTFARFAAELESFGAEVIQGIFLAATL